jgi:flagellar motor protein MotB
MPGPGLVPLSSGAEASDTSAPGEPDPVQAAARQDAAVGAASVAGESAPESTAKGQGAVDRTGAGSVAVAATFAADLSYVEPVPATPVDANATVTPDPAPLAASFEDAGRQPGETPASAEAPAVTARSAAEELVATFRNSQLGEEVEVTAHPGAVNLEISDSILFAPASAALSAPGLTLLDELAEILRTLPYTLSVEGHTDNVPIRTARYPSNWELSAARAAMVTRQLIEQGVAPDRVHAVGYGDTRPRGDNATAEGRAKNRRVTFALQVAGGVPASFPATEATP